MPTITNDIFEFGDRDIQLMIKSAHDLIDAKGACYKINCLECFAFKELDNCLGHITSEFRDPGENVLEYDMRIADEFLKLNEQTIKLNLTE